MYVQTEATGTAGLRSVACVQDMEINEQSKSYRKNGKCYFILDAYCWKYVLGRQVSGSI